MGYSHKKLTWNVIEENVANLFKASCLPPRKEVSSKIPADVYVRLLIFTFILPVIKVLAMPC